MHHQKQVSEGPSLSCKDGGHSIDLKGLSSEDEIDDVDVDDF